MPRKPVPPLKPGWVIVICQCSIVRASTPAMQLTRWCMSTDLESRGTYLEPTAALLAPHYRTFVPDLPGMGRSIRPEGGLDLPGLAKALMAYLRRW